ncbi:MAG: shikimate kinase [Schleiferiaceae bacterium]|nr:shikimate kinase [Schleiferiaceae bacterium]
MRNRYYLIGYMGVGKSTWAKKWAKASQLPIHDLDALLESRLQMSIYEYISTFGELAFRKQEREEIQRSATLEGIIAVGGGSPCFYDNMDVMNAQGETIYLHAGVGFLSERLRNSTVAGNERPLLKDLDVDMYPEFVGKHLLERLPYYEKAAHRISVEKVDVLESLLSLTRPYIK